MNNLGKEEAMTKTAYIAICYYPNCLLLNELHNLMRHKKTCRCALLISEKINKLAALYIT